MESSRSLESWEYGYQAKADEAEPSHHTVDAGDSCDDRDCGAASGDSDATISDRNQMGCADDDLSEKKQVLERLRLELFKVEVEENRLGYGPIFEAGLKKKKRYVRYKRNQAPVIYDNGRSSCEDRTLAFLREDCNISEEIELVVPGEDDRANAPPAGYFTLYECYIRDCLLWFPIPEVILRFLHVHSASLAQLMPRSVRHLVGILVRSYECGIDLTPAHYFNFLRFSLAGRHEPFMYYLSNQKGYNIIHDFKSKDNKWKNFFFYVPICEATVGELGHLVRTEWGPIGSTLSRMLSIISCWYLIIFSVLLQLTVSFLSVHRP